MPSQLALSDDAVVGREDRHVRRHRKVEAEVDLLVHFLALVDVRPVIGEAGLDLRVAELHERLASRAVRGRRACGERRDLVRVDAAQFAVQPAETRAACRRVGISIFSSGECSMISGTTRLMNSSSIAIRLRLNGFSKTLSTNVAVASLPASSRANDGDRRVEVLIVEQGEERDLQRRVAP